MTRCFVEWREGGRYFGRSYLQEDVWSLIEALRLRGVTEVYVDGKRAQDP